MHLKRKIAGIATSLAVFFLVFGIGVSCASAMATHYENNPSVGIPVFEFDFDTHTLVPVTEPMAFINTNAVSAPTYSDLNLDGKADTFVLRQIKSLDTGEVYIACVSMDHAGHYALNGDVNIVKASIKDYKTDFGLKSVASDTSSISEQYSKYSAELPSGQLGALLYPIEVKE